MPHSGEFAIQQSVEPFIAPALLNSWVNYGASFAVSGYYKDPVTGLVHLRGLLKDGVVGLSMFVLPVGYRPSATLLFPAITDTGLGRLDVLATGAVTPQSGGNTFYSISNISFRPV